MYIDIFTKMFYIILEIRCPRIKNLPNGTVTLLGKTVGSIVYFSCNNGYILFGPTSRSCNNLGSWTGITPSCISMHQYTYVCMLIYKVYVAKYEVCVYVCIMIPNGKNFITLS